MTAKVILEANRGEEVDPCELIDAYRQKIDRQAKEITRLHARAEDRDAMDAAATALGIEVQRLQGQHDDLLMLLRRALVKAEPGLRAQGIEYLRSKGLIGSHLRDGIEI